MISDRRIRELAEDMAEKKQEDLEEQIELLYDKLFEMDETSGEYDDVKAQIDELEDDLDFYDLEYYIGMLESERDDALEVERDDDRYGDVTDEFDGIDFDEEDL